MQRVKEIGYGVNATIGVNNPCFECGIPTPNFHHVIPYSRGGRKVLPLCGPCHTKAHGDTRDIYRGDLIREGIEKRRAEGGQIGRTTKITKQVIQEVNERRHRGESYKTIAKALGLSVGLCHKIENPP